jgi:hypothetical protein
MAKKLPIKTSMSSAITITRSAFKAHKLVYVGQVNKSLKYPNGRSRIAYIGTTQVGAKRIAASAAKHGLNVLQEYGVKQLDFYRVTCKGLPGLKAWEQLERALLITFREMYGRVPFCNLHGQKLKSERKPKYFKEEKLRAVILQYK